MSGKKIYSNEVKLKMVKKYLEGKYSYKDIANEFYCNKCDVIKWVAVYREHGASGLCNTYGTYTGDFKVTVVEYIKNTGTSIRQTAAHFNIPSSTTVGKWERIYYEQGKEALYINQRGRPKGMENNSNKKKNLENSEDLLAEVQRLRMENEYLKKLNALVQEREKSMKPTK